MSAEHIAIRLSARELMYLKNVGYLPASLLRLIEAARPISDDNHALSIPQNIAEQFRSAFTDRLARAGFNADYEPTSEGRMLEDLIDRFYSA